MIVSFTGAQSTGKTTLLNSMRSWKELRNYKFIDEITPVTIEAVPAHKSVALPNAFLLVSSIASLLIVSIF